MEKNQIKEALMKKESQRIQLSTEDYYKFLDQTKLKNNDVIDMDDQSHLDEASDLYQQLDTSIHNHQHHLETIKAISFEPKTIVEPGAIVSVNGRCMIIAVSKAPFKIGERNFIGISTDAPIYAEMKGKKAGDTFTLNNQKFTIEVIN